MANPPRPTGKRQGRAVIASDRPWNAGMVATLRERTAYSFELISTPRDLTVERLSAINPRFVFFPHWSHRIEPGIHKQFECVVFHMTDLPFGRGGSPLQNLIVRGIYVTKISAFQCVDEMDAGPIYLKRPLSLHGSAEEIFIRTSGTIADMIVEILASLPAPTPQAGSPTLFDRRTPEDGDLASARSLEQAFDMIRMLDAEGYPNAFLKVGPFKIEFTRAAKKTDQLFADARIRLADDPKGGDDR